jgi:hypothetical protein
VTLSIKVCQVDIRELVLLLDVLHHLDSNDRLLDSFIMNAADDRNF